MQRDKVQTADHLSYSLSLSLSTKMKGHSLSILFFKLDDGQFRFQKSMKIMMK